MSRSRPIFYRLIGRLAVPCETGPRGVIEWAQAGGVRPVAVTEVGPLTVSTIFLGVDHNHGFGASADAILFETMILGGEDHIVELGNRKVLVEGFLGYQTRCATWDEAERQHAEAVAFARDLIALAPTVPAAAERQK